eukprot:3814173-Lingulodinium_polyedra.AAC.1
MQAALHATAGTPGRSHKATAGRSAQPPAAHTRRPSCANASMRASVRRGSDCSNLNSSVSPRR